MHPNSFESRATKKNKVIITERIEKITYGRTRRLSCHLILKEAGISLHFGFFSSGTIYFCLDVSFGEAAEKRGRFRFHI